MRLAVRSSLVLLAVLALCSCGGKDSPTGTTNDTIYTGGTVTLSGAVSHSYTSVILAGSYNPTTTEGGIATSAQGPPVVTIGITFPHDVQTGTVTQATSTVTVAAITVTDQSTGKMWTAMSTDGVAELGTFTINITSTGTLVTTQGVKGYVNMRGTLNATLAPMPSTPATGTITLVGNF